MGHKLSLLVSAKHVSAVQFVGMIESLRYSTWIASLQAVVGFVFFNCPSMEIKKFNINFITINYGENKNYCTIRT